jgi:hypothetical protein
MEFLIVTFELDETTAETWEERTTGLAPSFAAMPHLCSKTWLADPASGVYGGAYLWRDRRSLDAYLAGPVYRALPEIPGVRSVESRAFAVLDAPTRITARGALSRAGS